MVSQRQRPTTVLVSALSTAGRWLKPRRLTGVAIEANREVLVDDARLGKIIHIE